MATQTVTLLVDFDPDFYDAPADWDWSTLADTRVSVLDASPVSLDTD